MQIFAWDKYFQFLYTFIYDYVLALKMETITST